MPTVGSLTSMNLGGGSNNATTGGASGSAAANASDQLERCESPLGTLALVENQSAGWYTVLRNEYRLPPTANLLRLMVQQSNCFVVVERSAAGLQSMDRERALAESGNTRSGSNMGRGQMVAADYSLSPEVLFSNSNAGGASLGLASLLGSKGDSLARVAGGLQNKEATAMLSLVDNRSGVQVAVSEGSASKTDFNFAALMRGSGNAGNAGAYSRTEQGKVIAAAFADAYNNMVRAARQYQPQRVKGQGLGGGGRLSVDGAPAPSRTTAPAPGR
ncbi:MAG: peptidoglycan-binding protein [Hydrogenophaga sp.]|uniref:CsgG/HfaB family protein n=1 Tax=Hydrogenophaga sp. TaxID=1904254 RepID=UPI001D87F0DA|nr:CsgG/HfaB family protein [Hydrogenophaga sp.]MBX3610506.1 peptidoglycan-binding protein [Hydrogenophaga sp.]